VRQQYATAQPVHPAAITGVISKVELGIDNGPLPLADVSFSMGREWLSQRLKQFRHRALVAASTRNGDGKFTAFRKVDFARQRDIALSAVRNSQSILKLVIKSCQPSLAPT
jgi:hypothetical protein